MKDPARLLLAFPILKAYLHLLNFYGIERTWFTFATVSLLYTGYKLIVRRETTVLEAAWINAVNLAMYFFNTLVLYPITEAHGHMVVFGLVFPFLLLIIEYIHFRLFERDEKEKYTIKVSESLTDFLLVPVVVVFYYLNGPLLAYNVHEVTFDAYLALIGAMFVFDIFFAVAHVFLHHTKAGWAHHKRHHEYKLKDLNSFANFYSTFLDGLTMVSPTIASFVFMWALGWSGFPITWAVMADLSTVGYGTHNKYASRYMSMFTLYEFDVILDLLGYKIVDYHHLHHRKLDGRYSVFGTVPDTFAMNIFNLFGPSPSKQEKQN